MTTVLEAAVSANAVWVKAGASERVHANRMAFNRNLFILKYLHIECATKLNISKKWNFTKRKRCN